MLSTPWAPSRLSSQHSYKLGLFLALSYTEGNWGTERLSNLPSVNQPANDGAESSNQDRLHRGPTPQPKGSHHHSVKCQLSIVAAGVFWPEGMCLIPFPTP